MWSFVTSVLIFIVLVVGLGLWQRRTRRTVRHAAAEVDQQIHAAAEVAQRRHVQRFGRASTDLKHTLNGAGLHVKS
jgi:cytochrome oxidase assembly protein ShyY1